MPQEDNAFEKAESLARRVLEKLGKTVEGKIMGQSESLLGPVEIEKLCGLLERSIESSLIQEGNETIAPDRFKVLLTYEQKSQLNEQYIEVLNQELASAADEFIANRRYRTRNPIQLEIGSDLFAKAPVIKTQFTGDKTALQEAGRSTGSANKRIELRRKGGETYHVEMKLDGTPFYIGRSAGATLRIDHPSISRLHCSLTLKPNGELAISDLGSSNGTYTNGDFVRHGEARVINPGDCISVGDVELTVITLAD